MLGDGVRERDTHSWALVSTSQVGDPVTTENKSLFANSPSAPAQLCGGQRAAGRGSPGAQPCGAHTRCPAICPCPRWQGLAEHALGCMSSSGPTSQPQGRTDRGMEALHLTPQEGHSLARGPIGLPTPLVTSQPCPLVRAGRPGLPSSWLRVPRQALALLQPLTPVAEMG